jgi:hypothetical protein
MEEPALARSACIGLQLSEEDKSKLMISATSRVFSALKDGIWHCRYFPPCKYGAADKAISNIYALYPAPETETKLGMTPFCSNFLLH